MYKNRVELRAQASRPMPAAYVSHVGAAAKSAVDDSPARGLTVPMISRSASIVDRPLSSPPVMVGEKYSVHAILHSEFSILGLECP